MRVVRALSRDAAVRWSCSAASAWRGALWYGSEQIAAGRLTTGQFTSFLAALLMMYAPAKKLSRVNANLQQAIAAGDRIFEMLDTHTEVAEVADAPALPPFSSGDRVPRRELRLRRRASARDPAQHLVQGAGRADGGDRRPQRRRQDDAGEPDPALLRRQRRAPS